jgi:hypothetical protein
VLGYCYCSLPTYSHTFTLSRPSHLNSHLDHSKSAAELSMNSTRLDSTRSASFRATRSSSFARFTPAPSRQLLGPSRIAHVRLIPLKTPSHPIPIFILVSRQPSNSDRPRSDPHSPTISTFAIFGTDHIICSTVSQTPTQVFSDDRLARSTIRPVFSRPTLAPANTLRRSDAVPCCAAPYHAENHHSRLASHGSSLIGPQIRIAHRASPSIPISICIGGRD